jgi:glycosyltransferase involved in cell wall biosynthesis
LTIIQYAGDYREAFDRFAKGGKQTYYAQRYSVNFVGSLAQRLDQVTVICGVTEESYDVVLDNGVRAIGAGLHPGFNPSRLVPLLSGTQPTRLCLTSPLVPLLKWAKTNRIRTIVPLADSFEKGGLRETARHWRLAYYLNGPFVEWIGNHGISACLSLLKIGVAPEKVVPWDWPPSHRPSDYPPRTLGREGSAKLLYVGSVTKTKGVGDLLQAVARLRQQGVSAQLSVIGRDPDGAMTALAHSLHLGDRVSFVGILPNEDVPAAMRAADIVVIPSWHEYPEGLPLTIYEALSARTPIVASDHPMFRGAIVNGESALTFPAGNADELAATIVRLMGNSDLYAGLSDKSEAAWHRLQLPVRWGDLLEAWVADDPARTEWIRDYRLLSGRYEERIRELRKSLQAR